MSGMKSRNFRPDAANHKNDTELIFESDIDEVSNN